ncbi:MAG: YkgJ family cysteine cluster protein [Phycisphaerales bacterium]
MSEDRSDWFEASPFGPADDQGRRAPEDGLRFRCTMCGNCCTGAPGSVMLDGSELADLSAHLGLSEAAFVEQFTKPLDGGASLRERLTAFGWDCVFLDRTSMPGRAVCGVYDHRPLQCRTWPFWKRNLGDERSWDRAATTCPGMNSGPRTPASLVRLTRDASPI